MPRLREPRAVMPSSGGAVMIDLPPIGNEPEAIVYGSSVPNLNATSSSIVVRPLGEPEVIRHDPQEEEDGLKALQDAQRRAEERARAAEQDAANVRQWGTQQAQLAAHAQGALVESQADTIASALAAAEAEAEAAEDAMVQAKTRGDFAGEVKAQRALMKAESRIATLQAGKDEIETAVRRKPAPAAPPAPPPSAGNVEAILAQLPNLMPQERDWIRSHPEAITQRQRELDATFRLAEAKGLQRGSTQYFEFFNQQFGYDNRGGDTDAGDDGEPDMPTPAQTRRVAAPVSRSGGARGIDNPNRVVLTEQQREMARLSGVSEVDYARGVQRLREAKRQGLYQ